MNLPLKIYKVTTSLVDIDADAAVEHKTGQVVRLVRASTAAQALRHVADQWLTAALASQDDLVELVGEGVVIEKAFSAAIREQVEPSDQQQQRWLVNEEERTWTGNRPIASPVYAGPCVVRYATHWLPIPKAPNVGDYVLATKYVDGDPGDGWALGFYAGKMLEHKYLPPRHNVVDGNGKSIRGNCFRQAARIRKDVGRWLLTMAAKPLEQSPPGTVSLWTMLTPAAFDESDDQA